MKCSVEELLVKIFVSVAITGLNLQWFFNTMHSPVRYIFAFATILGLLSFVFVYPWWKKGNSRV